MDCNSEQTKSRHSSGCPYCSGSGVHIDGRNSMAVTNRELAAELMDNEFGNASELLIKYSLGGV